MPGDKIKDIDAVFEPKSAIYEIAEDIAKGYVVIRIIQRRTAMNSRKVAELTGNEPDN